jgi:hypothetical protein
MPESSGTHDVSSAPAPSPQIQRLGALAGRPASANAGGAMRSTLTVNADRSGMTARWERNDDGSTWQPWMDMTFTRMR